MGEYNFDKVAKKLSSKCSLSKISNKDVLVDGKDYEAVYREMAHKPTTNILINPMKEGEEVELEVGPGKSSLIWMVTTKSDLTREEGTRIVTFEVNGDRWFIPFTDHNTDLDRRGGQEKSTEDKGQVGLLMPGVAVGLKANVGDETVAT